MGNATNALVWQTHPLLRVVLTSLLLISSRGETRMALISANELKRKLLITVDGQPYVVIDVFFASPTARGAATMVRTRLRQLLTGAVLEKSFRSSEKFEEPDIELAPASFLYNDVHGFHFMDEKSYEQFTFDDAAIDADRGYLKEGVSLQVLKYNGAPVSLQLPQYVELRVTSTELGLRGDTAAGGATKMATLETGLSARVPLFIKEGEVVRVNTQTGEVAGRA
jgi:elongation factor P